MENQDIASSTQRAIEKSNSSVIKLNSALSLISSNSIDSDNQAIIIISEIVDNFEECLEIEKNNPNNEYNIIARDGGHAGVAYHDYWFNFIYKKYLDKNDNFRN